MQKPLLSHQEVTRCVRRIAAEIVEAVAGVPLEAGKQGQLCLVGIRRGGVPVAECLRAALVNAGVNPGPLGTIDITLYRDDASTALPDPKIGPSHVPFEVEGSELVLVDDVLQTGRTVRAGIECLLDYGRPRRLWLVCLIDRGGRELPIAADFVGRRLELDPTVRIDVVGPGEQLQVEARQPRVES